MPDIGKGDWVLCVEDAQSEPGPKAGCVYHVDGVSRPDECGCGDRPGALCWGVDLSGFEGLDYSWCHTLFRPLKKPPEEAQTRQAPAPEKEHA